MNRQHFFAMALLGFFLTVLVSAYAEVSPPILIPPAPNIDAKGFVLMDAQSGSILAEKNMNNRMPPASLTKMMTLYLTFQALKNGQIHLADPVRISKHAWQMTGSRMFVKVGTDVPLEKLIQGVIVASGNDACVALAEYMGGTEAAFAQLMNQTAGKLGMGDTHFVDSTGMPNSQHYTTPHDMALLTRALINDFPEYYHYFSEKWLTYNNIRQPNRNRLLWRDTSVDGLKTGHTDSAGYCLISSGQRNQMRLISVVMGASTDSARASGSQALLNYGFRFYKTTKLFSARQQIVLSRVWMGNQKTISLGLASPLYVTIPVGQTKNLKLDINAVAKLHAPLMINQSYGTLTVSLAGNPIIVTPLIALQSVAKAGVWGQMSDHVSLLFHRWL